MSNELELLLTEMAGPSTPVSADLAASLVRERYGLDANVERLTGERDENFRVSTRNGAQYVLKIANTAEEPEVTDLQIATLLHLAEADPGLPCPRVHRDVHGSIAVHFKDAAGTARSARMLSFLAGRPLRHAPRSSALRHECATLAARMGRALRSFEHPAAHRSLVWDVRQLPKLRPLLDELPDLPHRPTMLEVITAFETDVLPRMRSLRHQVIHNDLNDRNVLVEDTDDTRIAGFIDFGDVIHSALVADIAVMIAEQLIDAATLPETVHDLVRAYHETEPLTDAELAVLKPLVAARIVMSVVIPSWHRHRRPAETHYARVDHDFVRRRMELVEHLSRVNLARH